MRIFGALIFSYLLGSIPTAYLVGKFTKGIDIRQHGSGNVGATNAFRILGKGPGIFVLVFDIIKGFLAVVVIGNVLGLGDKIIYRLLLGLAVISGHNWTLFLNFKGGKGIATTLGVLIGLTVKFPSLFPVVIGSTIVWFIAFSISRYVSLSSIIAAISLPIFMFLTRQQLEMIVMGIVFSAFVIVRHRPNISRLLAGTETRMKFPSKRH